MSQCETDVIERRRRTDDIEAKLKEILEKLEVSDARSDKMEEELNELRRINVIIHKHIEMTCEIADSVSVLSRPLVWIANRIQKLLIWLAALSGAVITIWLLIEKAGWFA